MGHSAPGLAFVCACPPSLGATFLLPQVSSRRPGSLRRCTPGRTDFSPDLTSIYRFHLQQHLHVAGLRDSATALGGVQAKSTSSGAVAGVCHSAALSIPTSYLTHSREEPYYGSSTTAFTPFKS